MEVSPRGVWWMWPPSLESARTASPCLTWTCQSHWVATWSSGCAEAYVWGTYGPKKQSLPTISWGTVKKLVQSLLSKSTMNPTVVSVGLPCWLVKGSHQGLIRETKLIPSHAWSHVVEVVSLLLRPLVQTSSKHHNVIALHRERTAGSMREWEWENPTCNSRHSIIWLWHIL